MPSVQLPQDENSRLAALQALRILDTPSEEMFDRLTRTAARMCGTKIALISLVDAHRQWFKSAVGLEVVRETPREVSICTYAIEIDGILEIPDTREDPRFRDNPLVVDDPNIRFYAGAPLVLSDGHRVGTLCVIDDKPGALQEPQRETLIDLARTVVTILEQRRSLGTAIGRMSQALIGAEAANSARSQYLGTMSHELRTPLNAIIGFSDILRQEMYGELPVRYREAADLINSSGDQLLSMVNDLLELSRLELDAVVPSPTTTDFSLITRRMVRALRALADARGVKVQVDAPPELLIHTDERLLRQIMTNIIANVLRLASEAGVVRLTITGDAESVALELHHDGDGLSANQLAAAFVAFPEIGDIVVDRLPGMPLALPIAHRLAKLLRGTLEMLPDDDGREMLRLTLPTRFETAERASA